MASLTRRALFTAFGVLGAGGILGVGYVIRGNLESSTPRPSLADGGGDGGMMGGGMMGVSPADMNLYMEMFNRHNEISRVVEQIPGGVRTTTQSNSPDLAAKLHAHVSSMYSHLDQRAEVTCMSQSLPTLFRKADGYLRQLTFTPTGVIADESADDPDLTQAIRAHAVEISGFVRDGMPAMMRGMMGPH